MLPEKNDSVSVRCRVCTHIHNISKYEEGFMTESKSILLFELANIEESIRKQYLKICDSIYFGKVGIRLEKLVAKWC